MIVQQSQVYLNEDHVEELKEQPGYVFERYQAVARALAPRPFRIQQEAASGMIKRSIRQMYRILRRFHREGIPGLKHRSRRPRTPPKRIPEDIQMMVMVVREASTLGINHVAAVVNESLEREGRPGRVCPSTVYNILVRNGVIERERRERKKWRRFEWGHPDRLIQADLTVLNGVQILTMVDDHSRKGWATTLKDANSGTVINAMEELLPHQYDNLLTDNGSQFSRNNALMRVYCDQHVREKHIRATPHHPNTLGKVSAFQKGLKAFPKPRMKGSGNRRNMQRWTRTHMDWYNNGRYHQGIKDTPETRYSGHADEKWYERLVKSLKLTEVLTVARRTGDICP